ncbi:MAG TPA: SGNH hydrolase domain-containing protein, partial [Acidimicrobiales bacterium]|nr:SGNH hydrolase domain-containing protein [Acidimicrobiales bacterium]
AVSVPHTGHGPSPALSPELTAKLSSAHAFTDHPIRFLLVGDSIAKTAVVGLEQGSIRRFGVWTIDGAVYGCDYDRVPAYYQEKLVIPFNLCLNWQSLYAAELAESHPQVVGILVGRWTICDRVVDGKITFVGQPAWDAHVVAEYSQIVDFFLARHVKVVLFNLPYFDPPDTQPDGAPYPEDEPSRVQAFDRDLAKVAADSHGRVDLFDLNAVLCPHGHFQSEVDGVVVRMPDGLHVSLDGGIWLQPRVLPTIAGLGVGLPVDAAR